MLPYTHVLFAFDGTLLDSASLILGSSRPPYPTPDEAALARPYPGVCDTVASAASAGARLGLVTSKDRTTAERGLRVLDLARCFEVIVSADDISRDRPHAEPVAKALSMLDIDPAQAIFIGDDVRDVQSGRQARVQTAAVLWGPRAAPELENAGPDFLVEDVQQLRSLLGV